MAEWRDVMPTIPLARGVPVIENWGGQRQGVVFCHHTVVSLDTAYQKLERPTLALPADPAWMVDLDTDLGFLYALRMFGRQGGHWGQRPGMIKRLSVEGIYGTITDEHRLELARALRDMIEDGWTPQEANPTITLNLWTDPGTETWDGKSLLLTASRPLFAGFSLTWVIDGTDPHWNSAIPSDFQTEAFSDQIDAFMQEALADHA